MITQRSKIFLRFKLIFLAIFAIAFFGCSNPDDTIPLPPAEVQTPETPPSSRQTFFRTSWGSDVIDVDVSSKFDDVRNLKGAGYKITINYKIYGACNIPIHFGFLDGNEDHTYLAQDQWSDLNNNSNQVIKEIIFNDNNKTDKLLFRLQYESDKSEYPLEYDYVEIIVEKIEVIIPDGSIIQKIKEERSSYLYVPLSEHDTDNAYVSDVKSKYDYHYFDASYIYKYFREEDRAILQKYNFMMVDTTDYYFMWNYGNTSLNGVTTTWDYHIVINKTREDIGYRKTGIIGCELTLLHEMAHALAIEKHPGCSGHDAHTCPDNYWAKEVKTVLSQILIYESAKALFNEIVNTSQYNNNLNYDDL